MTLSSGRPVALAAGLLHAGHHLGADPDLAARRRDVHRAVHRLHRWRAPGRAPRRSPRPRRSPAPCRHRPPTCRPRPCAAAGGAQARPDLRRCRRAAFGPVVPGDVERLQPLLGRPHVVADHRHQIVQHHHLANAGHGLGLAVVDVGDLAAEHRAVGQGGELHARRAGRRCRTAAEPLTLSGVSSRFSGLPIRRKSLGVLQRRIGRRLQARGPAGQGAVGDAPAAGVVDHLAGLGAAGRRIDAPAGRGGLDQHRPRRRRRPCAAASRRRGSSWNCRSPAGRRSGWRRGRRWAGRARTPTCAQSASSSSARIIEIEV